METIKNTKITISGDGRIGKNLFDIEAVMNPINFGMDWFCGTHKEAIMPERYIINDGATVLFWKDGTKTVVKRSKDDEFNPRLGFLTAYFQKNSGLSRTKANKFLDNLEVEDKKKEKIKNE